MYESKHKLEIALAPLMKANGYGKHRLTWHKQCSETILVFHCEKNRWGADEYSFHSGIYLAHPDGEQIPPYYRCPIQVNLEGLVPNKFELRQVCNFDYTKSNNVDKQTSRVAELVSTYALPWLKKYSTISQLCKLAEIDYDLLLPNIQIFRHTYDYLRELNTSIQ